MFNKRTRRLSPGIHTAAVTPFRRGEPDLKAFNRLLSDQLSSRVAGVVVLGTTGEAPTVTDKERGGIVSAAAGLLSGKKELTVGCGSNDTAKTVRSVREAAASGDAAKARSLFYSLYPLIKALGCDTNPVPIKALLSAAGYMTDEVRPPLLPLDGGKKAALLYAAAEAGIYMDQGE